jgi:hypothetical protein
MEKPNIYGNNINENEQFQNTEPTLKKEDIEKIKTGLEKLGGVDMPQMDVPFDYVKLPSKGVFYKINSDKLKVAYLTASDENILTNPTILESGEFLEILLNRKILDLSVRYKDLLPGDRNAIMLWLRATGYGKDYEATVTDPNTGEQFNYTFDLTELQMKELEVMPDEEGLFDFELPISKTKVKFKFLTVGDIEEIEDRAEKYENNKSKEFDIPTYSLKKQIVEINGVRDKNEISKFVDNMLLKDAKELRKYINKIEPGINMEVEVKGAGRSPFKTFLPIGLNFFWDNL